ncbi:LamG-like jellyroll fold domain-containing protein [Candidatus Methanoperedens nitratireducens]|uniref:LamG-like jellyroll fold domain-containing protein n=1 Tax=Candidatus Methanoperedens nitratireducens TaxID=1392998 RepID=UPI0015C6BE20|nr:LamG-like jellyroll fold domain-containing protein [Candidatus Methanoperedens nitroreducens]
MSVKLTSALLAFLFIIAPLAPALAEENSSPAATESLSPQNTAVPANTDTAGITNSSTDNAKSDSASPVGNPEQASSIDSGKTKDSLILDKGNKKDKNGTDTTADAQAMTATSNSSTSSTSSNSSSSQKQIILNPNDINGSLTYDYPITVPPGRNGLQPDLKLSYNSQLSSEESAFGYGWNINIPYIERINRKGTDKLYTENYFNSSLSGELVLISGTSYGSKVDNGEFLKYDFSNNSWLVTDKNGTKYKFGYSAAARQDNPTDSTKVFKWMLEEVRDTNDNYIRYEYLKDAGQIYPSRIVYTGSGATDGIFEVEFLKETVSNAAKSYKTGFAVTTSYRINEIRTKVNGNWVKKYVLGYKTTDKAQSFLGSITESGQDDGGNITILPAISFDYQKMMLVSWDNNRTWTEDTSWQIPVDFYIRNDGNYPQSIQIADVNGDGLQDLLKSAFRSSTKLADGTYQESNSSEVYLNNGHGWTQDTSWTIPVAFQYYRNSKLAASVQIADVNGDGLADILRSIEGGADACYGDYSYNCYYIPASRKVYINNGHGWTLDTSWSIPVDFYSRGTDSSGRNVVITQASKISDINGDGLADIVKSVYLYSTKGSNDVWYETNNSEVYLNNGHGWTQSTSWPVPMAFYYKDDGRISQSVQIADINGDNLPDLLRYIATDIGSPCSSPTCYYLAANKVYLNSGNGWEQETSLSNPHPFYDPYSINSNGMRIADVNGDGLADVLRSLFGSSIQLPDGTWQEQNYGELYLNNGKGWTTYSFNGQTIPLAFYYLGDQGAYSPSVRIADINGDGLPDMLRSLTTDISSICFGSVNPVCYPIKSKKVYLNNGPKSDLLTRITYPTGGKTDIAYKATPLYSTGSTLSNPNLPFIMDTVQSIATNDSFGNTSTTNYSYEGGKYYYNTAFDRKFAGFAKITKTDAAGNITKTYYHQGDATNSAQGEFSDHSSKIGKPYRSENYDISGNLYSKTISKWENYDLGNDRNFVKLSQKINFTYDGNATHKDKAETYSYDNTNGNLTQKIQLGEVTGSDNGTFTDVGTDKLTETITYASNSSLNVLGLPSSSSLTNQSATKIKESRYYYDNLALGSVGKGNLTKEENWKDSTNYINTQKSYNSYGLVTQTTDPRGKITAYAYDSYNLYPISVTNPLSQITQYTYDYSAGKPKQTTDPNGFVFQTIYDGLDRVTGEKQPDQVSLGVWVTKSVYVYTDTANAVSVKKTDYLDVTTSVDSYSYFDGLGRLIQTRKEAEDANNFSVKDLVYNNRGLLQKESLPYFSTGIPRTSATADATLYSTYAYDPLGRIIETTNAVGTITNTYDDWKVTTTDAKGTQKDLYKDAYGNLIRVDEHGSTTLTTSYTYDGVGNLTKITDALGNIRNFTYNALGQRLTAQDLHASADTTFGTWTYTYDNSGNLISQKDPKVQTINYTYDDLNRQLTEDYTGATGIEATYAYDTCVNGKGRICSIVNAASTEAKEYNSLGLTSKETKTISSVNYITQYTYDRQGNQALITNPDNSQVKYEYNSAGLLEKISTKETTDPNLPSSTNLLSRWSFDETTGLTASDSSGNNNTGTLSGAMTNANHIPGISGNALDLDGINDEIIAPDSPSLSPSLPITMSAWVKLDTLNVNTAVISKWDTGWETMAYALIILSNGAIRGFYADGTNLAGKDSGGGVVAPGSWYHIAAVIRGLNNISLYVNGVEVSGTYGGTGSVTYDNTAPLRMGAIAPGSGNYLDGKLDEARIYSAALTTSNIAALYNNPSGASGATGFTDLVTNFNYSPLEKITSQTYANGTTTTNTYDSTKLYRLSSKVTTITGGAHAQDLAYTYDANGNITRIVDNSATNSKKTVDYTYDSLNRLLSATVTGAVNGQNYTETYAYNAIGNITSKNGVAYTYSQTGKANPHAVTSIGSANYTYDDNGNLLTDGTLTNTWNYDNRLTQSVIGSMTVSYIYDVSGQRIGYSNGTDTTYYPTKDYNITGEVPTKQIFARDQLVATVKGTGAAAQIYFVHADHLTGSNVVTNGPGTVEELMDYYPYGDIRLDEKASTFSEQRKYAGHEYDADTGLSYMNARYYEASTGRFISQDPAYLAVGDSVKLKELTKLESQQLLSDPQLLNSYAYGRNNPLAFRDPDGNFIQIAAAAAFMAFVTYAPQITSFLQSLTTPIGQVGLIQAGQDAQKGNYGMAAIGAITSGEVPAGKIMSAAGKTSGAVARNIFTLVNSIDKHGSYEKHVLGIGSIFGKEYGTLFQNKGQWREYVSNVIAKPSASFSGPTKDLYWDDRLGTIVINNKAGGPPTAFKPQEGFRYYQTEVAKQMDQLKGGGR